MNESNGKASIREVYEIVTRLEGKMDLRLNNVENRLSNLEGRASVVAIVWSSVISIVGIFLGSMFKK